MAYLTLSLNPAPRARGSSVWKILLGVILLLFAALGILILAFLFFIRSGLEKTETFHPHVTLEQMQAIEERTGIHFPKGSEGLCYFYNSVDCIDPSMQAKIRIPSDLVADFKLKELNPTGQSGNVDADFRRWWKPHRLLDTSTGQFCAESAWVQWTLGTENGDYILYLHWMVV